MTQLLGGSLSGVKPWRKQGKDEMMMEEQDYTLLILRVDAIHGGRQANTSTAYLGEELVVEDLIQGESVTRGFLQDS